MDKPHHSVVRDGARFHGDFQGLGNWTSDTDVLAELEGIGIRSTFAHTPVYEIVCFDFKGSSYLEATVAFFEKHAGLRWFNTTHFGGSGNFQCVERAVIGERSYVGEAAGFQDALFGFGLRYALISGHLAGRGNGSGDTYEQAWRRRLGGLNAASMFNRWLYARLGDRGRRVVLKRLVAGRDPRRLLQRIYAPRPWKTALGRWLPASRPRHGIEAHPGCDCTWCRCRHDAQTAIRSRA